MPDKIPAVKPAAVEVAPVVTPPVRRHPGHRGQDVRDTVAEMAAKAHEISMEAGSKMAAAMKDVIGAAAGYATFALESARDLVQYMVRRGQMTQDEADKLIREAEDAWSKKHKGKKPPARGPEKTPVKAVVPKPLAPPKSVVAHKPEAHKPEAHKPEAHKPAVHRPEPHKAEAHKSKPGTPARKPATKPKSVAKKTVAAKRTIKKAPAKKAPAKKPASRKLTARKPSSRKPAARKPAPKK